MKNLQSRRFTERVRSYSVIIGVLLGLAIWFGVQYFSGLDNFADSINTTYFKVLYATAFALGLGLKNQPVVASFAMVAIQPAAYFMYPNMSGELGNLFPIVAALLFACALPAVGLTFAASWLIRRNFLSRG
jgi:hypothetical protein